MNQHPWVNFLVEGKMKSEGCSTKLEHMYDIYTYIYIYLFIYDTKNIYTTNEANIFINLNI